MNMTRFRKHTQHGFLIVGLVVTIVLVGTLASSHASGARVGQYQCDLIATGGLPTIGASSANAKRQVTQGTQMQEAWIVGAKTRATTINLARWNKPTETQWNSAAQTQSGAGNLNAVSMLNYTDGWAVGSVISKDFKAYRWDAATDAWVLEDTGLTPNDGENLNGVSAVSTSETWAVGDTGGTGQNKNFTVLRWDGSTWCEVQTSSSCNGTSLPSTGEENLNAVHVIDTDGDGAAEAGWAVGNGDICSYNGSTWDLQASPSVNVLNSVAAFSPNDAWAVGITGTIIHWDGESWSTETSPLSVALYGISVTGSSKNRIGTTGSHRKPQANRWEEVFQNLT